jgi:predicted nucleic acid-binding protein
MGLPGVIVLDTNVISELARARADLVVVADLQIAAIARARGARAIATRNIADFEGCGISLVDPWTAG